jgi:SAM-dependent methyltransferase
MRLLDSHYLNDGRGLNDGRPVRLIQIESAGDYDRILAGIEATGYYGPGYLARSLAGDLGHGAGPDQVRVQIDNLVLAAIIGFLAPSSLLEIGCGKADVPFLLHLRGGCQVRGLDLSAEILAAAPAEVAPLLEAGDLLTLARKYAAQGRLFDLVCGFGIWERLHPARLEAAIAATLEVASPEALFFYIIPAFGPDRVFGEVLPLEFAENRASFETGQPFPFLAAESADPPIPQGGQMIWAPSAWWEERFAAHDLVRCVRLEENVHRHLGGYLHRSARSFFVLRRATPQARARERWLLRHALTPFHAWRQLHVFLRAARMYEHRQGQPLLDWEKSVWLEDSALQTMLASFESRLNQPWPLGPLKRHARRLRDELARRARDRLLDIFGGHGPRT